MFEDESLKCVDGIEVLTKDQIKNLFCPQKPWYKEKNYFNTFKIWSRQDH